MTVNSGSIKFMFPLVFQDIWEEHDEAVLHQITGIDMKNLQSGRKFCMDLMTALSLWQVLFSSVKTHTHTKKNKFHEVLSDNYRRKKNKTTALCLQMKIVIILGQGQTDRRESTVFIRVWTNNQFQLCPNQWMGLCIWAIEGIYNSIDPLYGYQTNLGLQ